MGDLDKSARRYDPLGAGDGVAERDGPQGEPERLRTSSTVKTTRATSASQESHFAAASEPIVANAA